MRLKQCCIALGFKYVHGYKSILHEEGEKETNKNHHLFTHTHKTKQTNTINSTFARILNCSLTKILYWYKLMGVILSLQNVLCYIISFDRNMFTYGCMCLYISESVSNDEKKKQIPNSMKRNSIRKGWHIQRTIARTQTPHKHHTNIPHAYLHQIRSFTVFLCCILLWILFWLMIIPFDSRFWKTDFVAINSA